MHLCILNCFILLLYIYKTRPVWLSSPVKAFSWNLFFFSSTLSPASHSDLDTQTKLCFASPFMAWTECAIYIYMAGSIIAYCQQLPVCFFLKLWYVTSEESTERGAWCFCSRFRLRSLPSPTSYRYCPFMVARIPTSSTHNEVCQVVGWRHLMCLMEGCWKTTHT